MKAETLASCARFGADASKCKEAVGEMGKLLGEKPERTARNLQDGANEEAATVLEACMRVNNASNACKEKAKTAFKNSGGDEAKFETQIRQGMGKACAEIKSSCFKKSDGNVKSGAEADACEELAKKECKKSGVDEKDMWADTRRGMNQMALEVYKDTLDKKVENDTEILGLDNSISLAQRAQKIKEVKSKDEYKSAALTRAKEYYLNDLAGDEADFDEEDFKKMASHADSKVEYSPGKRVEMQVQLEATQTNATDLNQESKTKDMQDAIKEAIEKVEDDKGLDKVPVTVDCGTAHERGSKTNIVCKLDTSEVSKASKIEEITRMPEFKQEFVSKYDAKKSGRRLNARRLTASDVSLESSQSLDIVDITGGGTGGGNGGNGGNNGGNNGGGNGNGGNSPAPADEDSEDILSGASSAAISYVITSIIVIASIAIC